MAINVIVQYNGGFLPDILLLTQAPMYVYVCMYVCMYIWPSHIADMDQPGKVTNPARGQLNRENEHSPVPVRA